MGKENHEIIRVSTSLDVESDMNEDEVENDFDKIRMGLLIQSSEGF